MSKTKSTDIRLNEASRKYTRCKGAVDGTPKAEAAYQKAKKELAMARQAHKESQHVSVREGDANVPIVAVAVRSGTKH